VSIILVQAVPYDACRRQQPCFGSRHRLPASSSRVVASKMQAACIEAPIVTGAG
jgi:hypothetical protein